MKLDRFQWVVLIALIAVYTVVGALRMGGVL